MALRAIPLPRFDHLTYRGNSKQTRYGWLRLTPAFSVHLIADLIRALPPDARVLDPFCGTGTTALVCAEEGIASETTDINPFLLWLGAAKAAEYSADDITAARRIAAHAVDVVRSSNGTEPWLPALFQIEKWWDGQTLEKIAKIRAVIEQHSGKVSTNATNLLKVAFCRTMIETANVSFGHQSMSFKKADEQMSLAVPMDVAEAVAANWQQSTQSIFKAAETLLFSRPRFVYCDARNLVKELERDSFDCVITSPPYPNRMSYIRELRPYMYWLGFLEDAKKAGEMDWEAIGGTWGCATSNLNKWEHPPDITVPYERFPEILKQIAETSALLSTYVEKYFCDMVLHVRDLFEVVKPNGAIHYIVGNSKFYDVMLPVEEIFAALFRSVGFRDVKVEAIRKRTSKKELFEFLVSGRK
jgi:SAM-dependent methyltransferase